MTPLTKCDLTLHSSKLLHPVMLVKVLLLLTVMAALALAQTHLRFRTRDLQIETRKLQKQSAELKNRERTLVAETERLKIYDFEFRKYARTDLGLQECPPERSSRVVVSAEIFSKWEELGQRLDRRSRRSLPAPSKVRAVAQLGQRVISWSTTAMAQEADGEKD